MVAPLLAFAVSIDPLLASRYFQEARWISDDDGGALWGRPLYGPIVFVDPDTREAVANEATPDPFSPSDGVYVGKLDPRYPAANTSFDWKGQRWTMVMWPLPGRRADRATLLMHECYHRLQGVLGLPVSSPAKAQLESLPGRLWLQLEIRALAEALAAPEAKERGRFARDALAFRAERYRTFPKAKAEEDAVELNEGLAEYTGYALRGGRPAESRVWLASTLREAIGLPSYTRRFPYFTGTAYAMLLGADETARFGSSRWRRSLHPTSSLATSLATLLGASKTTEGETLARARRYGYETLRQDEAKRDVEHRKRVVQIRRQLVDAPVLRVDLRNVQVSFDPRDVMPLGDEGTYYPAITVVDEWGTLKVTGGALIDGKWSLLRVAAPKGGGISGEGWTLTLEQGWRVVAGKRVGDFALARAG